MDIQRKENESFLEYAERLIACKKELDLDSAEVYEMLYGEQVSSDHARKCIANLNRTIEENKKDAIKEHIDKISNKNELQEELSKQYKTTTELNADGSQSSDKLLAMSEEQSKDVNFLLEAHGYDKQVWEITSARNNIWNSYSKKDGIMTLYSSKITVKPVSEYIWNEKDIRELFKCLQNEVSSRKPIVPLQYQDNGQTLVLPIADFHYGLLSDVYSTGNEYNLEIAEVIFNTIIEDVISRVSNRKFQKVLFIIGNDFINFDNIGGTTTKGTQQDNSGLWFTVVKKAAPLIVSGIDRLATIAPVDVLYVPSNHDLHTMFGIMQTLLAHYRNDKKVHIDDSPLSRKYYKCGNTLLGLSHDLKVKDGLKIMTSEAKDKWSSCEHMIWLLAHLHQQMIYSKEGHLETFRLPTASGWSRWSNSMGYIQSEKKNKAFIIADDYGIIDEINTIIL